MDAYSHNICAAKNIICEWATSIDNSINVHLWGSVLDPGIELKSAQNSVEFPKILHPVAVRELCAGTTTGACLFWHFVQG